MRSLSRAVLGGCGPVLALLLVSSGCGDGLSGIFGKQSVKLVGPGGGETWSLNTPCEITWTCTATAGVKIEISRDNGVTWETITDLADASPGSYAWTPTGVPSSRCLVRVSDAADGEPADRSDTVFTIAGITVTSPGGGETWYYGGADQDITWMSVGVSANVDIDFSTDLGATWIPAATDVPDTGSYTWTIPDADSTDCLVRVQETGGGQSGTSDDVFTITPPTITVTSPNGGETWYYYGSAQDIYWTSGGVTGNVDISYSVDDGSNWTSVVTDVANSGSYSWAVPNEDSVQCLVRVEEAGGGAIDESDGTFTIALGTPPSLAFDQPSSSGPESTALVNLSLTMSAVNGQPVTVDYAVTGGTATGGGTDHTLAGGTAVFNSGETTVAIAVAIIDDVLDEDDETIEVTLSNPTNATLGAGAVHTYTIVDDDPAPSVEFDAAGSSAPEAVTPLNVTVSLSAASGKSVTVDYTVVGGTATGGGTDYTLAGGTLTFSPGETSRDLSIVIVDDALPEDDETMLIVLTNPTNAALGAVGLHICTIIDDEAPPSVEFDTASSSGSEATASADLAVSLSLASGRSITVDYAVTGGTATGGGVDYTLAAGTLTFNPGQTTRSISVTVVDDGSDEDDEMIVVTISNPTNATLGAGTVHAYAITDDDPAPSVQFDLGGSSSPESVTPVNMAVSLSTASAKPVTVDYAATGGTATGGGTDYTLAGGTLTFSPGEATRNIPVTVVDDGDLEADETILIELSGPTNATLGATSTHTCTILDDDGDDNYEENDTWSAAYNLSALEQVWLSTIDGLGIQSDDDWYQIDITAGYENLIVDLLFTDADGDIDLEVYAADGTTGVIGAYSTTDNESIDYVLPSSGTYYLRVFLADAGNAYDLWWDDLMP